MALAQPQDATLRITVVDPSGAVIVGARASLIPERVARRSIAPLDTGTRGDATFTAIEPGRYTIHVESPGFEPADIRDYRVRAGDNRREIKLAIAKFAETVQVGRDPRERASDPRSDAFATVLDQAQIDELPDDPDEMEQVLREMGGPVQCCGSTASAAAGCRRRDRSSRSASAATCLPPTRTSPASCPSTSRPSQGSTTGADRPRLGFATRR